MNKLPLDIQIEFFKVRGSEISIADFEKWVYANKELEEQLDNETYTDLLSLNFTDRHVQHELAKLIDPFLDFGTYEERKLKRLLTDLIERTDTFLESLIATYDLRCAGYAFLENLGMGYGLSFSYDYYDPGSWERLTESERKHRIDRVYAGVRAEAIKILKWLDEGKIVFTGETDQWGQNEYLDRRTDAEKQSGNIQTNEVPTPLANEQGKKASSNKHIFQRILSWLTAR